MRKKEPQLVIPQKEPEEKDTIGVIFDYYRSQGYERLPPNVFINVQVFKPRAETWNKY